MSGEHELPTASVVPLRRQAPHARRRGQLCTGVPSQRGSTYRTLFGVQTSGATSPAGLHLSNAVWCADKRGHLSSTLARMRTFFIVPSTNPSRSPATNSPCITIVLEPDFMSRSIDTATSACVGPHRRSWTPKGCASRAPLMSNVGRPGNPCYETESATIHCKKSSGVGAVQAMAPRCWVNWPSGCAPISAQVRRGQFGVFRRFYLEYLQLLTEAATETISDAPRRKSATHAAAATALLVPPSVSATAWQPGLLNPGLSWSHYRRLLQRRVSAIWRHERACRIGSHALSRAR